MLSRIIKQKTCKLISFWKISSIENAISVNEYKITGLFHMYNYMDRLLEIIYRMIKQETSGGHLAFAMFATIHT